MDKTEKFAAELLDRSTLSAETEPAAEARVGSLSPALTILYHKEPRRIGERVLLPELKTGQRVALCRLAPLFSHPETGAKAAEPLADQRLSRQPLWLAGTANGGIELFSENPDWRVRYRGERVVQRRDITAAELHDGGVLELQGAVALVLHQSQDVQDASVEDTALLGNSHRMQVVRAELRRLARIPAPVLIRGESGTGKELAAQAIHVLSPRAARPFVAVNLAAIPPSLAAAELFGAERGAFTGASTRQAGYFQQAQGGTLFLDEIGEAPVELQTLLLRTLETGEVRSLGAGAPQKMHTRIISATDADLEALTRDKAFRLPLLHRLATCELRLPPLRKRREDIGPLVLHYLRSECVAQGRPYLLSRPNAETAPWLPLRVLVALAAHDWPGNVRQLRNVVRQMVVSNDQHLALELPPTLAELPSRTTPHPGPARVAPQRLSKDTQPTSRRRPAEISEAELLEALEKNHFELKATADALGLARPSLYLAMERWPQIRTARDVTADELRKTHRDCQGNLDAISARLRVSREALRRRLRELGLR